MTATDRLPAHRFTVRVYYEDTDAGGIVYHASYLRFAERARTEFLREMGFAHGELRRRTGGFFAVRRCDADFLRPAILDDVLEVTTAVDHATGARLVLQQTISRAAQMITRLEVELAFLGADLRPRRLPDSLLGGHR